MKRTENGLLKDAKVYAPDGKLNNKEFKVTASSKSSIDVVFVGEFNGNNRGR